MQVQPPQVLILRDALSAIVDEAAKRSASGQETGGILIGGYLSADCVLVVAATGPGPNAEHFGAEYALDIEYAQRELEAITRHYPSTDYLGEWHRHPGTFNRPSGGDWGSAARILEDPTYRVDALINPIVNLRNRDVSVAFYYLHRFDVPARRDFRRIDFEQVDSGDSRVRRFLDLERLRLSGRALEPAACLLPGGRRRLAEEWEALDERFDVIAALGEGDEFHFDVAPRTGQDARVSITCPPWFPRVGPSVRVRSTKGTGTAYEPDLPTWYPEDRLWQVAKHALRTGTVAADAPMPQPMPQPSRQPRLLPALTAVFLTAWGIVLVAMGLSNVLPSKSWCAEALEATRAPGRVATPAAGVPTVQTRALSRSDLEACRLDPRMPADNLANANAFMFSASDASIRIRTLAAVNSGTGGWQLSVDPKAAMYAYGQVATDQTPLQIDISNCADTSRCSVQLAVPPDGGIGIQVLSP